MVLNGDHNILFSYQTDYHRQGITVVVTLSAEASPILCNTRTNVANWENKSRSFPLKEFVYRVRTFPTSCDLILENVHKITTDACLKCVLALSFAYYTCSLYIIYCQNCFRTRVLHAHARRYTIPLCTRNAPKKMVSFTSQETLFSTTSFPSYQVKSCSHTRFFLL